MCYSIPPPLKLRTDFKGEQKNKNMFLNNGIHLFFFKYYKEVWKDLLTVCFHITNPSRKCPEKHDNDWRAVKMAST